MLFEPAVADEYEWVNCCNDEDYEVFAGFNGSRRAETWTPIRVYTVAADERQAGLRSDFPWLGCHALVIRSSVLEILHDFLSSCCEVLPLQSEDGSGLHVLNVTCILDALDEAESQILRSPDDGRVMWVEEPHFLDSVVKGVDMFRLPIRGSLTYVSERFVGMYKDAGFVGLEFKKVWG